MKEIHRFRYGIFTGTHIYKYIVYMKQLIIFPNIINLIMFVIRYNGRIVKKSLKSTYTSAEC